MAVLENIPVLHTSILVNNQPLQEQEDRMGAPDRPDRVTRYLEAVPGQSFTVVIAIDGKYDATDRLDIMVIVDGREADDFTILSSETSDGGHYQHEIEYIANGSNEPTRLRFASVSYTQYEHPDRLGLEDKKDKQTGSIHVIIRPINISDQGEETLPCSSILYRYQTSRVLRDLLNKVPAATMSGGGKYGGAGAGGTQNNKTTQRSQANGATSIRNMGGATSRTRTRSQPFTPNAQMEVQVTPKTRKRKTRTDDEDYIPSPSPLSRKREFVSDSNDKDGAYIPGRSVLKTCPVATTRTLRMRRN